MVCESACSYFSVTGWLWLGFQGGKKAVRKDVESGLNVESGEVIEGGQDASNGQSTNSSQDVRSRGAVSLSCCLFVGF